MRTVAESQFLQRRKLPDQYLDNAKCWFDPLLQPLSNKRPTKIGRPLIIGLSGCQGSGKSTLADYLCTMLGEQFGLHCLTLSLDDFYLTRTERRQLADTVHPLLMTRGVPGTHDIGLALRTFQSLIDGTGSTPIPRFDKGKDDRVPPNNWDQVEGPLDIIVLEGWCIGAGPQSSAELAHPVNSLEQNSDDQGIWRRFVNHALATDYQTLFALVDTLILLEAPSFDSVFEWRLQQEDKLRASIKAPFDAGLSGLMTATEIRRFIAHYQRITEHCLRELPARANYLFKLNEKRQIIASTNPPTIAIY